MDTPIADLPNYAKEAARVQRRNGLDDLNRRIAEFAASLGREYEVRTGIKPTRISSGPYFAQPAFEGAGKLPEAFLALLLAGRGVDAVMRKKERHELLVPLALNAIGLVDEQVDESIWNRPQHPKKLERMRKRLTQAGYKSDGKETTLGHFLKRVQAGRISKTEVDPGAHYWTDGKTLWFCGERIRVTWRGTYPQCSSTKKSVWRLLGKYAETRKQQSELIAQARAAQARLDAATLKAAQTAREMDELDALGIFD